MRLRTRRTAPLGIVPGRFAEQGGISCLVAHLLAARSVASLRTSCLCNLPFQAGKTFRGETGAVRLTETDGDFDLHFCHQKVAQFSLRVRNDPKAKAYPISPNTRYLCPRSMNLCLWEWEFDTRGAGFAETGWGTPPL